MSKILNLSVVLDPKLRFGGGKSKMTPDNYVPLLAHCALQGSFSELEYRILAPSNRLEMSKEPPPRTRPRGWRAHAPSRLGGESCSDLSGPARARLPAARSLRVLQCHARKLQRGTHDYRDPDCHRRRPSSFFRRILTPPDSSLLPILTLDPTKSQI